MSASFEPDRAGAVAPGAYAVVHGEEPQVFLAEDEAVISRVLALHVVAQTPRRQLSSPSRLRLIRQALLEERWDSALAEWIAETGRPVDVFPYAPRTWTAAEMDAEQASMEIRMAPIFEGS